MCDKDLSLKASDVRNVLCILPNVVPCWVVITNDKDLSFDVLGDANAKLLRLFPHHLREMSSSCRPWLYTERVLLYLIVPSVNSIFAMHFVIRIGAGQLKMHN